MQKCKVDGCYKDSRRAGLCGMHHSRLLRHGSVGVPEQTHGVIRTCSIDGCDTKARSLGMCSKHYQRKFKYGDPMIMLTNVIGASLEDSLDFYTDKSGDCWEWTGAKSHGYGQLQFRGKLIPAHRTVYELHNGHIEKGLCVLHTCDNPSCVNPKHLWSGTVADNNKDRASKGRSARGSRQHMAKLSEENVLDIVSSIENGESMASLARRHNVSVSSIFNINTGANWSWLTGKKKRQDTVKGAPNASLRGAA